MLHARHKWSIRRQYWGTTIEEKDKTMLNELRVLAVVFGHFKSTAGELRVPLILYKSGDDYVKYAFACAKDFDVTNRPSDYLSFILKPIPTTNNSLKQIEKFITNLDAASRKFHDQEMLSLSELNMPPESKNIYETLTYGKILSIALSKQLAHFLTGWTTKVEISFDGSSGKFVWAPPVAAPPAEPAQAAAGAIPTKPPTPGQSNPDRTTIVNGLLRPADFPLADPNNTRTIITVDLTALPGQADPNASDLSPVLARSDGGCGSFRTTPIKGFYVGLCELADAGTLLIGTRMTAPIGGVDWTVKPGLVDVAITYERHGEDRKQLKAKLDSVLDRGFIIKAAQIDNRDLPDVCNGKIKPTFSDLLRKPVLDAAPSDCQVARATMPKAWLDGVDAHQCLNGGEAIERDAGKVWCVFRPGSAPKLAFGNGWPDLPLTGLGDAVAATLAPVWPWYPDQVPPAHGFSLPVEIAGVAYCRDGQAGDCCAKTVTPRNGVLPSLGEADCAAAKKRPTHLKITIAPRNGGAGLEKFEQIVQIGAHPALDWDKARPDLVLQLPAVAGLPAAGADIRLFEDEACSKDVAGGRRAYLPPEPGQTERVYADAKFKPPLWARLSYLAMPLTRCTAGSRPPGQFNEPRIRFGFESVPNPNRKRRVVALSPAEGLKDRNRKQAVVDALRKWIDQLHAADHPDNEAKAVTLLVFSELGQPKPKFLGEYVYSPNLLKEAKEEIATINFNKPRGDTLREMNTLDLMEVKFDRLLYIVDSSGDQLDRVPLVKTWLYDEKRLDIVTIGDCAPWENIGRKESGAPSPSLTCHKLGTDTSAETVYLSKLLSEMSQ